MAEITLARSLPAALKGAPHVVLLAPRARLRAGLWRRVLGDDLGPTVEAMLEDTAPGPLGACATTWTDGARGRPRRVTLGVLPDRVSRHLAPSRSHAVEECVRKADLRAPAATVVVALDEAEHLLPVAVAIGRALPLFRRASTPRPAPEVTVVAVDGEGRPLAPPPEAARAVEASRWVAALVDRPPSEKSTADFVAEARRFLAPLGKGAAKVKVLEGAALRRAGLEGIHHVGRAASVAPRLLHVEHAPKGKRPRLTVALVGKGVVYDTGGLHLKPRGGMEGMKSDMGGAAAVVAAFRLLVAARTPWRLHCLAPLAENAIGPGAYKPDEVLRLHSGKTVEINNTDAEGRLLLGDAVSYAARVLKADVVIDAATLTGAQAISTGKRHAAVVSNRDALEALCVRAGRASGDLVHPLPFAPELYQAEFKSEVADMTNSVKDRNNAQSSCAAQFVYSHVQDLDVPWLHVDLARPAFYDGRGTGFGPALLAAVVGGLEPAHLEARA
ncbi:MAG: leucyl aminopeptidase family protein [Planctomycetes bacterium]|nr:leucyl aminopeptidase family protein [Planctomycetota bacterium]